MCCWGVECVKEVMQGGRHLYAQENLISWLSAEVVPGRPPRQWEGHRRTHLAVICDHISQRADIDPLITLIGSEDARQWAGNVTVTGRPEREREEERESASITFRKFQSFLLSLPLSHPSLARLPLPSLSPSLTHGGTSGKQSLRPSLCSPPPPCQHCIWLPPLTFDLWPPPQT